MLSIEICAAERTGNGVALLVATETETGRRLRVERVFGIVNGDGKLERRDAHDRLVQMFRQASVTTPMGSFEAIDAKTPNNAVRRSEPSPLLIPQSQTLPTLPEAPVRSGLAEAAPPDFSIPYPSAYVANERQVRLGSENGENDASVPVPHEPVLSTDEPIKEASAKVPGEDAPVLPRTDRPLVRTVVLLDPDRIKLIQEQTRNVGGILEEIFDHDEPSPVPVPPAAEASVDGPYPGLEARHAALLQVLVTIERCNRPEYEAHARAFDLMPDGALETINDWALERFHEAVIEDGDPIIVARAVLEQPPEA
ncbi:MAG: hypothetical protein KDG89_06235 [Geminicoccaceae bacterium]|nr:hypothetical protein [Geminicoccaceae bacterium]